MRVGVFQSCKFNIWLKHLFKLVGDLLFQISGRIYPFLFKYGWLETRISQVLTSLQILKYLFKPGLFYFLANILNQNYLSFIVNLIDIYLNRVIHIKANWLELAGFYCWRKLPWPLLKWACVNKACWTPPKKERDWAFWHKINILFVKFCNYKHKISILWV